MLERRRREVELLRRQYPQVEHGPDLDWVLFRDFALPPGWNRKSTDLLVLIPPGYPETPPDNFHVLAGLRVESGADPGNYSEGQELLGESWGQFSYHADEWSPTPGPLGRGFAAHLHGRSRASAGGDELNEHAGDPRRALAAASRTPSG